ncbi:MAG: hypothetical protein C0593_06620 [Marinilabiliales bacterium]|nr:MAG: hypothetical protein C0593_06620 [Marinilabiliales bacterium]
MNSQVSIFFIILLVVNISFAAFLFFISKVQQRKEITYICWALFLKALLSLGPAVMLFNINLSWTTFFIGPVRVALIPLIYLYITKLSAEKKSLSRDDIWHFLPTLLNIILALILIPGRSELISGNPDENILDTMKMIWENNPHHNILAVTSRVICMVQGIGYSVLTYLKSKEYINLLKNNISTLSQTDTLWIRWFIIIFMIHSFFEGFGIIGIYNFPAILIAAFTFELISSLFYTIFATLQQDLSTIFHYNKSHTANTHTADSEILITFKKNKYYLNPDLNLDMTAKALEISKEKLTKMIKSAGYENFYSFINTHRIEESKTLLSNIPENHVIESVILASGFKSRATFYRVFKQYTGITPTHFLSIEKKEKR